MTQIKISRKLTRDAELNQQKADATIQAVAAYTQSVVPVTREYLDKRIVVLESTLIKWVVGTGSAVVFTIIGTAVAAVTFLAAHYKPQPGVLAPRVRGKIFISYRRGDASYGSGGRLAETTKRPQGTMDGLGISTLRSSRPRGQPTLPDPTMRPVRSTMRRAPANRRLGRRNT